MGRALGGLDDATFLLPFLGGAATLVYLAAPHWSTTVDDVYTAVSYGTSLADQGGVIWNTGERVEGYSNFLMVLAFAGVRLVGGDAGLIAQLLALLSSLTYLATIAALSRGVARWMTVGIALWPPFSYWAVVGMETAPYALALSVGWVCLARAKPSWWLAATALLLSAGLRPEGSLFVMILSVVWLTGLHGGTARDSGGAAPVLLSILVLSGYHLWRTYYFGSFISASALVKLHAVPVSFRGAWQVGGDAAAAAGVLLACGLLTGTPLARRALLFAIPAFVHVLVLLRASGDWMAWSRFVMPGLLATMAAWLVADREQQGRLVSLPVRVVLAGLGSVWSAMWVSSGSGEFSLQLRQVPRPTEVASLYARGLDTPLAKDVVFAATNVEWGGVIAAVDAGMLSLVPGTQLLDIRGLNHRELAERLARGEGPPTLAELRGLEHPPGWIRLADWRTESGDPWEPDLLDGCLLEGPIRHVPGHSWWYSCGSRLDSQDVVVARLVNLSERFSSQPALAWAAALAASAAGKRQIAVDLAARASRRWPSRVEFSDAPESLDVRMGTRFRLGCPVEAGLSTGIQELGLEFSRLTRFRVERWHWTATVL